MEAEEAKAVRIIPTGVGKRAFMQGGGPMCTDHPHGRGEKSKWSGRPSLWHHEMGHHVDSRLRISTSDTFAKAVSNDYYRWKGKAAEVYGPKWHARFAFAQPKQCRQTIEDHQRKLGIVPASMEDRSRVACFFDTIAAASGGKYGWGHAKGTKWKREMAANMYEAQRMGWTEFEDEFPETWRAMKKATGA